MLGEGEVNKLEVFYRSAPMVSKLSSASFSDASVGYVVVLH